MSKYAPFSLLSAWPIKKQEQFIDGLPHVSFADREIILEKGEDSNDVYFILHGAVKAVNYGRDGALAYFRLRKAGDCFGYYSAISEQPRTATMIAADTTELAKISGADFFSLILDNPDIGRDFLKLVVGLLRTETDRLTHLTTLTAHQRVAAELLAHGTASGGKPIYIPDRVEFSSYLGMTRETLSRAFNHLAKKKLIRIDDEKIFILDQTGLEKFMEND